MGADLLAAVLAIAMAGLGWYRGTLVQVVTVAIAVLLAVFFDAWFPPIDSALAQLAMPLAEHPYLRKLVGFLGAYVALVTVVAILEMASRNSERAEQANRVGGMVIGGVKGVIYVVALAWLVETVTLWDSPPHELEPAWMRESAVMTVVGPWNPVRVYTLKGAIETHLARAEMAERQRERSKLDDAAAAATPDGEPPKDHKNPRARQVPEPFSPTPLEESAKARALFRASPMRALMDETASLSEWQGRGYGDLVRDPRVREILGDDNIANLLMGE